MRRIALILATSAMLVAVSACGGSDKGNGGTAASDLQALVQGTWASPCSVGTGFSEKTVTTFSGLQFTTTLTDYTNGACTGTGTIVDTTTGSFAVVGTVTANLGPTPVTAYQVNGTNSSAPGQTSYDLAYVNTTVTPNRIYSGDSSGVNDGSTAAKRPTTLDSTFYLVKQ
jgi:hypothetical protein